MRWSYIVGGAALACLAVESTVLADVALRQTLEVPKCMRECFTLLPKVDSCFNTVGQGRLTCECLDTDFEAAILSCVQNSCTPKVTFSTINTLSIECREPVRDRSGMYRTTLIVFYAMAVTAVIGRFATYFMAGRTSHWENCNMAVAFVIDTVLSVVCMRMAHLGLGKDIWKVDQRNITKLLQLFWLSELLYFASIGLVKISFLIFYLQIFPKQQFRRIVRACITFGLAETLSYIITSFFLCTPLSLVWTRWDGLHKGHCLNNNQFVFAHAGMGIVLDVVTLSLPITQIWNLQMPAKKKVGVLLMFGVGAFDTIVSILRLRSIMTFAKSQNPTWDNMEASMWSLMELQVAIVCACMPTIRLGLARLFPRIMGSSMDQSFPYRETNSHGNTHGAQWSVGGIGVTTSVLVSNAMRHQTHDEHSFVQLVEIDADNKSAGSDGMK